MGGGGRGAFVCREGRVGEREEERGRGFLKIEGWEMWGGGAKKRTLTQVGPSVVLVEEAGEIFEAHVLTTLSSKYYTTSSYPI